MPSSQFPPTRLRLIRLARGLTIDDMARAAGVNAQYLSAIERGMDSPSVLARIAAHLGEPDPARLLDRIADLEERVAAEAER